MSAYAYRRGSIFWALALIAVGGIFLYQNFNPEIHAWHIIAKFWPVLIIFWGASKLLDYLQAQAHPETAPPPLFAASEVILLVLILIVGTLISKAVLRPWRQWPGAFGINVDNEDWANMFLNSYTYSQSLTQSVKPQPHLVLEDQRGDLEIRGTGGSTIEVAVKKVIRAENEEAAKKLSEALKVEIVEDAGRYTLRSNRRSLSNAGAHVSLDLVVSVPAGTSTEINSEHGDATLTGLQGNQTVTVLHGDLHLSGVTGLVRVHKTGGRVEIHDVKGNVEVDGRGHDLEITDVTGAVLVNGDFGGSVQFRNVTQTLRYTSSRTDMTAQKLVGRLDMETGSLDASGVDGPFEISTRQKDITLENFKQSVKITNTNGDIQLRTYAAPTYPIEVNLGKGGITLDIPPSSNFQIEATSRHGEVDSAFSSLSLNRERETRSISGTNGKGGPMIHLTTSYGTIRLGHDNGAAPPPPPSVPRVPHPPMAREKVSLHHWRAHRHFLRPVV